MRPEPSADENLRLLQEIDANREFILMAYRSDPELLKRADPEIRRQFEPAPIAEDGAAQRTLPFSGRVAPD